MRRILTATIGLGTLLLQTVLLSLAFDVPVARAAETGRCEVKSVAPFPDDDRVEVVYRVYGLWETEWDQDPYLYVYVDDEKKWNKEVQGVVNLDAKKSKDVRVILTGMDQPMSYKLRIELKSDDAFETDMILCQDYATADMTKPATTLGGCSVDDVGVDPAKGTAQVAYTMHGIDDTNWADTLDPDVTITVDGKVLVDKDVDLRTLHASKTRTERYTVTGLTEKKKYQLDIVLREDDLPGFPDDIICKNIVEADMTQQQTIGPCSITKVAKHRDTQSAEIMYEAYGIDDTQWAHTKDPDLEITVDGKLFTNKTLEGFASMDSHLKKSFKTEIPGLTEKKEYTVRYRLLSDPLTGAREEICVDSTVIDMGSATNEGPIEMDAPLDEEGHAPYTWLSAKCLNLASGASNGGIPSMEAVSCVIKDTIRLLLNLAGFVSTALVVVGGFRILSATTDEARKSGKNIVTYALIGLIVVLCSFLAVQLLFGGGIL